MGVYFVQHAPDGLIKIGWASKPLKRLQSLQVGCPVPLVLRAVIECCGTYEADFHARFLASHAHGEWFHPTDDVLELIADHNAGGKLWQSPRPATDALIWLDGQSSRLAEISRHSGIKQPTLAQMIAYRSLPRTTTLHLLMSAYRTLSGAA